MAECTKKKLWIVSELFPPDETSTAYILGEVSNALAEKYDVKVICGPEIYDKRKKLDTQHRFVLHPGIEVFRVSSLDVDKNKVIGKIRSVFSASLNISKEVRRRVSKNDKVLLVTNPFPLIVLMGRLKRKIGFELNILVHDIFPENAKPANVRVPFKWGVKKLFDRAYACADLLIALGRDMKLVLKNKVKAYKHQPDICIIENWADIENIKLVQREEDGRIVIEYAGNIGRGQGLKSFIDNFVEANNNSLQFDLYGTGAVEDNLKREVHDKGIKNISFNGPYFRSEQNRVLNSCDLALVTLAEGLYGLGVPSKSYNIMAAGKAILFIGHPESEIALLVKEERIGFVYSPEDKSGIQAFLASLTTSSIKELCEMGARARTIAEEMYSKEFILEKFKQAI